MRRYALFFLCFLLIFPAQAASALVILDPENVTYMKAEVVQSGHVTLASESSVAVAEDLILRIYIPQEDSRQKRTITNVIGPDGYVISDDGRGNDQIVMTWEKPRLDGEIDYLVETLVEVETVPGTETRYFPVTSVIEPSKGIIESAYSAGGGEKSVRNMLLLGNWVHDNVDYDLSCEDSAFPAKWVFDKGIGTCDEFSTLLLSMLRTLDYNAWYVGGYAFLGGKQEGGESFGPHAWVEARFGDRTYSIDPTWAESPVDATHITFARLPDSNFTEHTEVRSRDVSINWVKGETLIEFLDCREESRIETSLRIVPESVSGGKNVMIIADMEADGCVATNLRIASCVDENGDELVDMSENERSVSFCDTARFHWLGETPRISQGMRYTCPVTVAGGGRLSKAALSITSEPDDDIRIFASYGRIFVPGQTMELSVTARNAGFSDRDLEIFAILGEGMEEGILSVPGRGSSMIEFELTAPQTPGTYELYVFSESGDLKTESIEVISERHLRITEISIPASVEVGGSGTVNVSVKNLGEETTASVRFQAGGKTDTKSVTVGRGDTRVLSFGFTIENEDANSVSVSVLDSTGSYEDSWAGSVNVFRKISVKEEVSGMLEAFIIWLRELLRSIFL